MDYKRLCLRLFLSCWILFCLPLANGQQRTKTVPYKLRLNPVVKTRYPTAAVADLSIEDLNNTTISSPADNQCLAWDTTSSKWINQTLAGGAGGTLGTAQVVVFQVPVLACLLYTSPSPRD